MCYKICMFITNESQICIFVLRSWLSVPDAQSSVWYSLVVYVTVQFGSCLGRPASRLPAVEQCTPPAAPHCDHWPHTDE